MPLLSVLIPTWNRVALVEEAVRSVNVWSDQVEIVVVDNGSDLKIFSELKSKLQAFPNTCLYRNNTNLGMVKNWNKAISYARGQWMSLLCSDDVYVDGGVARLLDFLSGLREPSLILQNGSIGRPAEFHPKGLDTVRNLALPMTSGNCWSRQIVESVGGFDERFEYSADAEFWYRIAGRFPVIEVRESFARYRQHEDNYMWNTWRQDDFLEQNELLGRTVLGYMTDDKNRDESKIQKELDQKMWQTMTTILDATTFREGKRELFWRYFHLAKRRAQTAEQKKWLSAARGRFLIRELKRFLKGKSFSR